MRKVPEMIGQTLLKGVDLGIQLMRFVRSESSAWRCGYHDDFRALIMAYRGDLYAVSNLW